MQKGTVINVKIDKVGFQGVGIGTLEASLNPNADIPKEEFGKKVLIQDTLPGEVVSASVFRNKKKFTEADKVETLEKSHMEITPRCKHFEICGGCKWQNLSYEEQLKIKETHVKETLNHLGGFDKELIEKSILPIVGCEDEWNYRNKVEFSFGWDKDMVKSFGLHSEGRRYDIFNIEECHIISEKMFEIGAAVRDFALKHDLQPFKFKENSGLLRSLVIRESRRKGETLVNLELSGEEFSNSLQKDLVAALLPLNVDSIYMTSVVTERGKRTERVETLLYGESAITEEMIIDEEKYVFRISPSSFFQTNTIQAEKLYLAALDMLDLHPSDTVLDLFCGTGTIGIIAAKFVSRVVGIELSEDAVNDAKINAERNGETNIEFLAGDIAHVLEDFEKEGLLDTVAGQKVIVDPPRSGLTPGMIEYILKLEPKRVSYVSCNPTTQARDLKDLCNGGYEITSIQPVDMFPHTYHIENVIGLTYCGASG